jgi:hypothetical protein
MSSDNWLQDLQMLAYRVNAIGVIPDLAGLGLCELWGVYCFLRRLSEGG